MWNHDLKVSATLVPLVPTRNKSRLGCDELYRRMLQWWIPSRSPHVARLFRILSNQMHPPGPSSRRRSRPCGDGRASPGPTASQGLAGAYPRRHGRSWCDRGGTPPSRERTPGSGPIPGGPELGGLPRDALHLAYFEIFRARRTQRLAAAQESDPSRSIPGGLREIFTTFSTDEVVVIIILHDRCGGGRVGRLGGRRHHHGRTVDTVSSRGTDDNERTETKWTPYTLRDSERFPSQLYA
jgi:hypothetical protein